MLDYEQDTTTESTFMATKPVAPKKKLTIYEKKELAFKKVCEKTIADLRVQYAKNRVDSSNMDTGINTSVCSQRSTSGRK